jgi:hypothetical protein
MLTSNQLDQSQVASLQRRLKQYSKPHPSGCIVWTGPLFKQLPALGFARPTHGYLLVCRYLLNLSNDSTLACHTCDNRHGPCVNIEHLYKGTHQTNGLDASARGQLPKGEQHPNHKYTQLQIAMVKTLLDTKQYSRKQIALATNVNQATVSLVARGKAWKDV